MRCIHLLVWLPSLVRPFQLGRAFADLWRIGHPGWVSTFPSRLVYELDGNLKVTKKCDSGWVWGLAACLAGRQLGPQRQKTWSSLVSRSSLYGSWWWSLAAQWAKQTNKQTQLFLTQGLQPNYSAIYSATLFILGWCGQNMFDIFRGSHDPHSYHIYTFCFIRPFTVSFTPKRTQQHCFQL